MHHTPVPATTSLHKRLQQLLPGGVNSPVRSFAGLGDTTPMLVACGHGAWVRSTAGHEFVDYIHGWGSIITGHAHPAIITAIEAQLTSGLGFGVTTSLEAEFAEELTQRIDLPMMRALNSGTEATMTAIRLVRGHTGRDQLLKFTGCYHGHVDSLLVAAGSGNLTCGVPSSAGVPTAVSADTVVAPYNDAQALADIFARCGDRLAAVIVEPVAGNMNLVVPTVEFMQVLADSCAQYGVMLISDEVMTGLRATPGLAIRDLYGIEPDLACLGKVIGGGLPVAALAGGRDIMEKLAPLGPVYQAGTLAGNPICLAAGLAALRLLDQESYTQLNAYAAAFVQVLLDEAKYAGITLSAQHVGGMAGYYFTAEPPTTITAIADADQETFAMFASSMLSHGVLLPPSRYEACFVGLAHNDDTLAHTREATQAAFATLVAEER